MLTNASARPQAPSIRRANERTRSKASRRTPLPQPPQPHRTHSHSSKPPHRKVAPAQARGKTDADTSRVKVVHRQLARCTLHQDPGTPATAKAGQREPTHRVQTDTASSPQNNTTHTAAVQCQKAESATSQHRPPVRTPRKNTKPPGNEPQSKGEKPGERSQPEHSQPRPRHSHSQPKQEPAAAAQANASQDTASNSPTTATANQQASRRHQSHSQRTTTPATAKSAEPPQQPPQKRKGRRHRRMPGGTADATPLVSASAPRDTGNGEAETRSRTYNSHTSKLGTTGPTARSEWLMQTHTY